MRDAVGTLRIEFSGGSGDAQALAALVAASARATPGSGAEGGRVVLVRRARVELAVPASAPETVAREAGRALDGALRGVLRRPRPEGDTRVFPSTAEYVAHFVEELAAGRVVDVWYFGPLLPFRGRGLGDTLANLARAEPDAWPEVLRLLRRRGLLPSLLERLTAVDRDVLRGVSPPPPRPLSHDEGWPLFQAAWSAARAALDAAATGPGGTADCPAAAAGTLPSSPDAAFRLYLETHPAAPAGWDGPGPLGACVACMVAWLLGRAAAPADAAAGEAVIARHPWIDPVPARRVLREHATPRAAPSAPAFGRADAGPVADAPPSAPTPNERLPARRGGQGGPMNRTRALRFLAAARVLAAPGSMGVAGTAAPDADRDPLLELEDEVWAVDAAAACLAGDGAAPTADAVLARLERDVDGTHPPTARTAAAPGVPAAAPRPAVPPAPASDGPGDAPARQDAQGGGAPAGVPNGPLALVTAAARHLDAGERMELAAALAARARARPLSLETTAVGVFFLIRPLADLGVAGLAARVGLPLAALRARVHDAAVRAAAAPDDLAAGVVAWGGLGGEWAPDPPVPTDDPRWTELSRSLLDQAARLGLALDGGEEDEPGDVGGLLLRAACRQLVRWMRGFEGSSTAYVLKQLVRCPGAFRVPATEPVEVVWPASGLDVLLERAGYLDPLAAVPWWDGRGVRWER